MTVVLIEDDASRTVCVSCGHGEITCTDEGRQWTEEQLVAFAQAVLAARARCSCFGDRVWFPPKQPEHVTVEVRLYEIERDDPTIDRVRPAAIPPMQISLAAERVFETRIPADDHDLDTDMRWVRWWWLQRQLGQLPDA